MEFKTNLKNLVCFHLVSPWLAGVLILSYFFLRDTPGILTLFLILLAGDILLNLIIIFRTYAVVCLEKKSILIIRGFFHKKKQRVLYSQIKGIKRIGLRLPGFKPFNALILQKGIFYVPKRDTPKIFKSYIDDLEFDKLEKELLKKIS